MLLRYCFCFLWQDFFMFFLSCHTVFSIFFSGVFVCFFHQPDQQHAPLSSLLAQMYGHEAPTPLLPEALNINRMSNVCFRFTPYIISTGIRKRKEIKRY